MAEGLRTARTYGVNARLSSAQRAELASLRISPAYPVLLDLLEQICIEQESRLINAPVTEPATILAEHGKAQGLWQLFQGLQIKIDREVRFHDEALIPDPLSIYSEEEQDLQHIVDPTSPL